MKSSCRIVTPVNRIMAVVASSMIVVSIAACDTPGEDGEEPEPDGPSAELVERAGDGPDDIDDGGIDAIPDDPTLVEEGQHLYRIEGCAACHLMDQDHTGPGLRNITEERSVSWLAKVIMHPEQMRQRDPLAQHVAEQYPSPMPETNLDAETTRAILAYLAAQ